MAYQTVNPATNQLIKEYPSHTDADVEAALKAADALYHSDWAKGDISQRLPVLHKLADLIDERVEDLAKIMELPVLSADARSGAKPGSGQPGDRQARQHRAALCRDLCTAGT